MKYLLVNEDDEIYVFTEKEYHEHIVDLQNGGFDFEGCLMNQADTIEDLCECIVVRNKAINRRFVYSKAGFRKRVERNKTNTWGRDNYEDRLKYLLEYNDVYGAIWTNKGLIYIAKMNNEGELELL